MRLYHATYQKNLDSIRKYGLVPAFHNSNWDGICTDGQIFLAFDAKHAIAFAESADKALDEDVRNIVLLSVDSENLDEDMIHYDFHVHCDSTDDIQSLAYDLPISPEYLREEDINGKYQEVPFGVLKFIANGIWAYLSDVYEEQIEDLNEE